MANNYGPKINNNGLVFCLDAASKKTYPTDGLDVEYLVVAGGGGGPGRHGGGGGAGGLISGSTQTTISTGTYSVVVGAGGTGGVGAWTSSLARSGNKGSNSSFASTTASGGGGGISWNASVNPAGNHNNQEDGGSGGGGCGGNGIAGFTYAPGDGISGQGNDGGQGFLGIASVSVYNHPGGGGAGSAGRDSTQISTGDGGVGLYYGAKFSNNLGDSGWFAGGGAGGSHTIDPEIYGDGGIGGGADNPGYGIGIGNNGSANTGGGGSSGNLFITGTITGNGGNGGSGVVIIRYLGPPRAKGGDLIFNHRGYTVHVFNSSGSFIVGETAADLSLSKKPAYLTNMAISDYTPGTNGYFSFDGTNQYIDAGIDNTKFKFSLGDKITVIAAVNPTNINQQTYQAFMTIGGDPNITRDRSYQMRIANYSGSGKIDTLYRNSANTSWNILRTTNQYAFNNQWIIIASTFIYGTGSSWKIYINGESVPVLFYSGTGNDTPIVNTNQLFIGIGEDANSTSEQWYGKIGNVLLYRDYLSADQIRDNFNATRGRYGL